MEPKASSGAASRLRAARAANASVAAVLATGCFYLIAAPQPIGGMSPESGVKRGPTRPTAVQSGVTSLGNSAASKSANTDSSDAAASVKVIGATIAGSGKACDEQTWPYIEARCLTVADDKSAPPAKAQSTATPLGLRDLLAGVRPAPTTADEVKTSPRETMQQPVGSVTAIAPTHAVKDMQANTVRGSSPDTSPRATDGVATRDVIDVPMPQPRPDVAHASSPVPDAESDQADRMLNAPRPISRAEQRRMEREHRRAARQLERERRRQERLERRVADGNRIVRRWTEYTYEDNSRTVVIQQGSQRDRFFLNYR